MCSILPFRWVGVSAVLTLATGLTLLIGCSGTAPTVPTRAKPVGSVSVWCPDARDRTEFQPRMTAWANRTGAVVTVAASEASADVLLVPAGEIGRLVVAGEVQPVAETISGTTGGFQWSGLLRVYQSGLVQWGGKEYAIPLVGEGYVLVYRNDRLTAPEFVKAFSARHNRDPLPIRTWEDLKEVGELATARDGKPGLPPVPAAASTACTTFCQIAACYDRTPITGSPSAEDFRRGLSFLADGVTGRPRIDAPAFVEALNWFHSTKDLRPKSPGDPLDALVSGTAVAAIVPLADLTRLPKDVTSGAVERRFGIGSVPGTRTFFTAKGVSDKAASANFVPYYAGSGLVGMVRQSAALPDDCWALLAELGNPNGTALTIGSPAVGGGPLRSGHVTDGSPLWGQYRFDSAGTANLAQAMRQYASIGVVNSAVGLRTPDREAISGIIAEQVKRAATGEVTGAEAAKKALDDWTGLDAKTPEAERKMWRKRTAGME